MNRESAGQPTFSEALAGEDRTRWRREPPRAGDSGSLERMRRAHAERESWCEANVPELPRQLAVASLASLEAVFGRGQVRAESVRRRVAHRYADLLERRAAA